MNRKKHRKTLIEKVVDEYRYAPRAGIDGSAYAGLGAVPGPDTSPRPSERRTIRLPGRNDGIPGTV